MGRMPRQHGDWCGGAACRAPVTMSLCAASVSLGMALAVLVMQAGCAKRSGETPAALKVERVIGSVGTWPGQFATPRAMDTDGSTLWVIDKTARIQRLDAATGDPLSEWKTPRHERGMPVGVSCAVLGGRRVLMVPDTHEHRVLVYDPGDDPTRPATQIAEFGTYGDQPGQFVYPTDVVVVNDPAFGTRIYVAEYGGTDRVSAFNEQFEFQFAFGKFGTGEDPASIEFNRPQSIVYDRVHRELIVADACNHRLGRFTPEGKLIAWIGSPQTAGSGLGQFMYPYGLALLDDGTALVVEYQNGRVQRVDLQTGRGLETFGENGRGKGQLVSPWSICLIDRTAYVVDGGNNRVQVFRSPRPALDAAGDIAARTGQGFGIGQSAGGGG